MLLNDLPTCEAHDVPCWLTLLALLHFDAPATSLATCLAILRDALCGLRYLNTTRPELPSGAGLPSGKSLMFLPLVPLRLCVRLPSFLRASL